MEYQKIGKFDKRVYINFEKQEKVQTDEDDKLHNAIETLNSDEGLYINEEKVDLLMLIFEIKFQW